MTLAHDSDFVKLCLEIPHDIEHVRIYPNEVLIPAEIGGLYKESIVLCYQIRTLDKRRMIREIGEIRDLEAQQDIVDALCFQLGIST